MSDAVIISDLLDLSSDQRDQFVTSTPRKMDHYETSGVGFIDCDVSIIQIESQIPCQPLRDYHGYSLSSTKIHKDLSKPVSQKLVLLDGKLTTAKRQLQYKNMTSRHSQKQQNVCDVKKKFLKYICTSPSSATHTDMYAENELDHIIKPVCRIEQTNSWTKNATSFSRFSEIRQSKRWKNQRGCSLCNADASNYGNQRDGKWSLKWTVKYESRI